VDVLKAYGVEYVSANIGSTFRSLWDSVVNYGGDREPKSISVLHEEMAVAMAHGYAKASGRPMAVLLHDLVGLQHASMAIYNAWCDRVPILLLGASGPMGTEKRRPWIDWIHTANPPNVQVRDYVKWDDLPHSIGSVPESLIRAFTQMLSYPQAPVYVCFDSGYLEEGIPPGFSVPDVRRYALPTGPAADVEAIRKLAKDLVHSEAPYIVAGRFGRKRDSVRTLVDLAELLGASVIDLGHSFNFPNTHPLDATDIGSIGDADAILSLDAPMLELATAKADKESRGTSPLIKSDARVYEVGLDNLLVGAWAGDSQRVIPAEARIQSDSSFAVGALVEACSKMIEDEPSLRRSIGQRIARATTRHSHFRRKWLDEAMSRSDESPISPPALALEIWKQIKSSRWAIAHGTLSGWARRLWDWTDPGCFLGGSGGAGLGYGLPASVGAALAMRHSHRLTIDLQPDGDLLYSAGALWTASHYRIPLLIVVFNNRQYYNDAEHNRLIALARGRDEARAFHEGGDLTDPEVDFATLARSYGVQSFGPVEKREELRESLRGAIRTVGKERLPVLVDVLSKGR
jgi:thiamine pyrophosphate-dependent acetolactate synthase large subunit-like protein